MMIRPGTPEYEDLSFKVTELYDCPSRELNSWEEGFIINLQEEWIPSGNFITPAQAEKINEIYDEKG